MDDSISLRDGPADQAASPTFSLLGEATALRDWLRVCRDHPYDRTAREQLAGVLWRVHGDEQAPGTVERSRAILGFIRASFPTAELHAAYFANLERLLQTRTPLARPGRLALGLGPGRCGSTSVTAILGSIEGSCCTHENPPLIYWQPAEEQLRFHLLRFTYLLRFFPLVFDAAHWWVNVVDRVLAHFPKALLFGLWRDPDACARSFLAVKGDYNHWASAEAGWRPSPWDPAYPTYALPVSANWDREDAKRRLVHRYVADYYTALADVRRRHYANFLDLPIERLSEPRLQTGLFHCLGMSGKIRDVRLNVGRLDDGNQARFCW